MTPRERPTGFFLDPAAAGDWNMAVDQWLLEQAVTAGFSAARFYQWSPATLSLGYFQREKGDCPPFDKGTVPFFSCPAVRRLTGGGAILHDRELTYSFVLAPNHPLAPLRQQLYQLVHNSLIDVLADWSIGAALHSGGAGKPESEEPFLCFERRSPGDVVFAELKIGGSAQRRRRGAVLQHGSILLEKSPAAPHLPGLNDLSGRSIRADELARAWLPRLARVLCLPAREIRLDPEDHQTILCLASREYNRDIVKSDCL
jgi:lipoate-protein ligase A